MRMTAPLPALMILCAALATLPLVAQQQTISLPYAHPGQHYLEQLSPEISGHYVLPFVYAFRPGFNPPSWLRIDSATAVIQGTPPVMKLAKGNTTAAPRACSFVIDIKDAAGTIVRTLLLQLTVSNRPERLQFALDAASPAESGASTSSRLAASEAVAAADPPPSSAPISLPALPATGAADPVQEPGQAPDAVPAKLAIPWNKPVFVTPPAANSNAAVQVSATGSSAGDAVFVQLLRLGSQQDTCDLAHGVPISLSGSVSEIQTDGMGNAVLEPAEKFPASAVVCAYQTLTAAPDGTYADNPKPGNRGSQPYTLTAPITITPPTIPGTLQSGSTTVNVSGMPTDASKGTANVALYQLPSMPIDWQVDNSYYQGQTVLRDRKLYTAQTDLAAPASGPKSDTTDWILADNCPGGVPVALSTGANPASTNSSGVAPFMLATPLQYGDVLCANQEFQPANGVAAQPNQLASISIDQVPEALEWGRVRAYFAGGVLIANNNVNNPSDSGFSSAHQFYSFNIDKAWMLPRCYPHCDGHPKQWLRPGFNTYFDTRLTAIPVAATPAAASSAGSGASGNGASSSASSSAGTATTPSSTGGSNPAFLTTQKTARLGIGMYFPFLLPRWRWNHDPNALFVAPLAKIGFDTLAAPSQQTFIVPGSAAGGGTSTTTSGGSTSTATSGAAATAVTQNFNQLYNFYGYGARIGHYKLTRDRNKSPEIISYLDIVMGKYSNLPSFTCVAKTPSTSGPQPVLFQGSSCNALYPLPGPNSQFADVQTRLYRLDLEGILKVPYTPAFVGFNANIGQRAIAPKLLDRTLQSADDLRFVFGFRVDIGTLLKKIGASNPFE